MAWVARHHQLDPIPSTELITWLEVKNLTKLLKEHEPGLGLSLQQAEIASCNSSEQNRLNLYDTKAFLRRVFIGSKNNPCIYARVVFPLETYQRFKAEIDAIQSRFIGEAWLYQPTMQNKIQRSNFEYNYVGSDDDVVTSPTFARRSVFTIEGYPLLLTEWFLDYLINVHSHS